MYEDPIYIDETGTITDDGWDLLYEFDTNGGLV